MASLDSQHAPVNVSLPSENGYATGVYAHQLGQGAGPRLPGFSKAVQQSIEQAVFATTGLTLGTGSEKFAEGAQVAAKTAFLATPPAVSTSLKAAILPVKALTKLLRALKLG